MSSCFDQTMSFFISRHKKKTMFIAFYHYYIIMFVCQSDLINAFLTTKCPSPFHRNSIGVPSIHNAYPASEYISRQNPKSSLVSNSRSQTFKPLNLNFKRGTMDKTHLDFRLDNDESRRQSSLFATGNNSNEVLNEDKHESIKESDEILPILHNNNFGHRIFTIQVDDLMRNIFIAEVHLNGKSQLCMLDSFKSPSSSKVLQPLVNVVLIETESDCQSLYEVVTVDLGQITTVWKYNRKLTKNSSNEEVLVYLQSVLKDAKKSFQRDFPANHIEVSMQKLYNSYVGRARGYGSLTKKQISKIASKANNKDFVENILRKAVKGGDGMSRLVDSLIAMDYFYGDYPSDNEEELKRRFICAEVLSLDSNLGGRFKRMSLIFLDGDYTVSQKSDNGNMVKSLTFLNGGWIVQDLSTRAGTEARKFAERSLGEISNDNNVPGKAKKRIYALTEADERIMKRLECLAMGENLDLAYRGKKGSSRSTDMADQELELDLRESLRAMNLPVSPEGAQQALIQLGCWSEQSFGGRKRPGKTELAIEPWSSDILEAGKKYSTFANKLRERLFTQSNLAKQKNRKTDKNLEGRIDLTHLPSVCIDAERVTFRDDAIGVRPRSSTGRKVIKAASKWEILIHIADVSDIYNVSPQKEVVNKKIDTLPLKRAAESRGISRYDLPLGPLHLMPPIALNALALLTENPSNKNNNHVQNHRINRCVTLWAYIDERSGKLIDAGLERTLISSPIALSFSDASTLLESNNSDVSNPLLKQAKLLLSVTERNLICWSKNRISSNKSAKQREERLAVKEMIAKQTFSIDDKRDDGYKGSFQRTRGHLLVDAALDLHGYALSGLFWRAKAPVPRASGSGADRGGRLGTAPLRRYIDGVTQRQALSVLCGYGDKPMTNEECKDVSKVATKAMNNISNFRSKKDGTKTNGGKNFVSSQRDALRTLTRHLSITNSKNGIVPAITTGRKSEVIILGIGAIGKCVGDEQNMTKGSKVSVKVVDLDPEKGILNVKLLMSTK